MQKIYRSTIILGTLVIFSLTALLPAFAGTTGRKNTAILLTGATAYSVLKKNDRAAILLGLGSAQAWKSYEDSRKRDSRRNTYKSRYYGKRGHAYGHYKNKNYRHNRR